MYFHEENDRLFFCFYNVSWAMHSHSMKKYKLNFHLI